MSHCHQLLLADDDPVYRDTLREYLLRNGFLVRVAQSGDEAFELLRRFKLDLLVMDVNMPVLSGPEVLVRLWRECGRQAIPPTLLVSSDASTQAWVKSVAGIHLGFLPKPVQLNAMRRYLKNLLFRAQFEPQPGLGNAPPGLPD